MTKDGSFKKVVRRHAAETGQRYTEAKADIEGLDVRIHHSPVAERLVDHLRDHYGICLSGHAAQSARRLRDAHRPSRREAQHGSPRRLTVAVRFGHIRFGVDRTPSRGASAPAGVPYGEGERPLGRHCQQAVSQHHVAGGRGCAEEACP